MFGLSALCCFSKSVSPDFFYASRDAANLTINVGAAHEYAYVKVCYSYSFLLNL